MYGIPNASGSLGLEAKEWFMRGLQGAMSRYMKMDKAVPLMDPGPCTLVAKAN